MWSVIAGSTIWGLDQKTRHNKTGIEIGQQKGEIPRWWALFQTNLWTGQCCWSSPYDLVRYIPCGSNHVHSVSLHTDRVFCMESAISNPYCISSSEFVRLLWTSIKTQVESDHDISSVAFSNGTTAQLQKLHSKSFSAPGCGWDMRSADHVGIQVSCAVSHDHFWESSIP